MNPARRLLEDFMERMKITAPVLLFLRRAEQPGGFRLALADIAQPIRKRNCSTERHPKIPSRILAQNNGPQLQSSSRCEILFSRL
jgi:hypothetical protein